jgi:metal-responsive CopG/Arc/MetJ family transcriptional regulator
MASHTIKVSGISDDLLRLMDERLREQHSTGRSEYIRELIRRDVLGNRGNGAAPVRAFREILAPVHEETRRSGETEEELEAFLRSQLEAHRREQAARSNRGMK